MDQASSPDRAADPRPRQGSLIVLVCFALALLGLAVWFSGRTDASTVIRIRLSDVAVDSPGDQPLIAPQTYKPLTRMDAEAMNDQRPLDKRALEIAFPFLFPVTVDNQAAWQKAVHCLALANYYEAASEGIPGMRAVSQVILNRVRHPAFPKSVCDVVFQGSERTTGCQFTFTCDGSLKQPPDPGLFAKAQAVATAALAGSVDPSVGMATHYHTRWVVPYWADNLDKIRTLGAHIFYVWKGATGNRAAFRGSYAGETVAAEGSMLAGVPTMTELSQVESPVVLGHTGVMDDPSRLPVAIAGRQNRLIADEQAGSLVQDETAGRIAPNPVNKAESERIIGNGR